MQELTIDWFIKWTEKWREVDKASSSTRKRPTGCKENHFYSLPIGQAEAAFTSLDVILTSSKNSLTSRIDFTVLLLFEFLKKHHLPIGQVKSRIYFIH